MLKCVKITSFFFALLFELLPDTTSTVSGDCDFLRSCVNYKYIEKKKKKKKKSNVKTIFERDINPNLDATPSPPHPLPVAFFLNNSETVKAVTLAVSIIQ